MTGRHTGTPGITERTGRTGRTGRRPGRPDTAGQILAAARAQFAAAGYDGATVRGIAAAAGVDPALVHHFYGSKQALFAAAVRFPIDPATVLPGLLAGGVDGLGERLVRFFLATWDTAADRSPLFALIRSAASHAESAALLREFVARQVLGPVAAAVAAPDPQLRAALVGSQLIGLGFARYVIGVPPLATAPAEAVVAAVAPTVQRYLTGELTGGLDG